jgi:alginate O-acetyltransferase complex protein AlgJ
MSPTRLTRTAVALLAIAFFIAPIAARGLGITAEAFENRAFATAPKLSQGWDAFQQATQFLIDRMPLRAQATRANTQIWTDVFNTDPQYDRQTPGEDNAIPFAGTAQDAQAGDAAALPNAAQVIRGEEGWLYLQNEQDMACGPAMPVEDAVRQWSELARIVRGSGRRAVVVVAPDKSSIYPEHMPDGYPGSDCAPQGRAALHRALERAGEGVIPLHRDLLERKRRERESLYLLQDSHWNTLGSLELVRAVLAEVGRGIRVKDTEIGAGHYEYVGDLAAMIAVTKVVKAPQRAVVRVPSARKVSGHTVYIGDSFSQAPLPQLVPFFADLRHLLWADTAAETLIEEIAAADTVIFQTVERELVARAVPGGVAGSGFADALRSRLSRR